jgi:hypothetical protein
VTAGGGGKVLQVVQATTAASVSTSSSSQTTTGLTANITPSSATSKVLVMVSQNGCVKSTGSTNTAMSLRLARSGSSIHTWLTDFLLTNTNIISHQSASLVYLDAPATTSATTYNTTFISSNNTASVEVQNNSSGSVIILMEIGA